LECDRAWEGQRLVDAKKKVGQLQALARRGKLFVRKGFKRPPETKALQRAYRKANKLASDVHADHPQDLVVGGDPFQALQALDATVNTSIGSQLRWEVDLLENGTPITEIVTINCP
jgi:hypothetical protein